MPDEPEVHGLLAPMLMNDARREARFADGELVLLRDRRTRSNRAAQVEHYGYLQATRAELLCRLDRTDDASAAFERAPERGDWHGFTCAPPRQTERRQQ